MDNTIHLRFDAKDRSYFSILKKEIHGMAISAGFSESRTGEIDIVVAEMASNLVKHAGGGEILVRVFSEEQSDGIELISVDNGKGIADPAKMLEDGMSTSNTLGHGLGAIKRLSGHFELYSLKDWGTIILSRIYKKALPHFTPKSIMEVRSVVVAKPGELVSGDGFYWHYDPKYLKIFLGDGLGHGVEANKAVTKAIDVFKDTRLNLPTDILRQIHSEVKKTRGLVGTVATYSFNEMTWRLCGIGNIATKAISGMVIKNHISYNGIIGMNIPNTMKEQEWLNDRGQVMIMCSDGIRNRFDTTKYPGIMKYDLTILATAIYKDHARNTDDMSVLISRINPT